MVSHLLTALHAKLWAPGPQWAPFAPLYGAAVLLRRHAYDRGLLSSYAADTPTISVGGLEAGGTGKTPVSAYLLGALAQDGRQVGLLTRGYGRTAKGLVLRKPGEEARAATIGDEPAMIVQSGLDIWVAACAQRALGAQALVAQGCDTLLLDDGFAHRALRRHVDIVVLRGEAPFGNGHLLPWGSLREPPSSLARAQVVWLHFRSGVAAQANLERVTRFAPKALVVTSRAVPLPARTLTGQGAEVRGVRVVAAAGIARPHEFGQSLASMGAEVMELVALPDHYTFTLADVERLFAKAQMHKAYAVVVTPKDLVKLGSLWPTDALPLWAVGTGVELFSGGPELVHLLQKL